MIAMTSYRKREQEQRYRKGFATRLRSIFAGRDYTVNEFARDIGINSTCMYAYINGKQLPTAYTLAKICAALECDANELLGI